MIEVEHLAGRVRFTIADDQVESLQGGLSDLLCWLRGYQAAAKKSARAHGPMGIEAARDLSIALRRGMERKPRT